MRPASFLPSGSRLSGNVLPLALALGALCALPALRATTITPVPVNSAYDTISGDYTMEVDNGSGGDEVSIPVVKHWVEHEDPNNNDTMTQYTNCYYANFSFSGGPARVMTTLTQFGSGTPSVVLSPQANNVAVSYSGDVVMFTIYAPGFYAMKVTNSSAYPYYLLIIADAPESSCYTVPASSGTGIYNITASPYNAADDYSSSCTTAISAAIAAASSYGTAANPGIVYVPEGCYKISGPITPKSNVKVYLAPGAILRADTNGADWPVGAGKGTNYMFYNPGNNGASPYYSTLSNFTLYGRGMIDCKGIAVSGGAPTMTGAEIIACMDDTDANGTTFNGVLVRESTSLTFQHDRSENITMYDVKVINYAQDADWRQNDGVDFMQCYNSVVDHCLIFTADDALCFKGGGWSTSDTNEFPVNDCICNDVLVWTLYDGCKFGFIAATDATDCYFSNINEVTCKRAVAILPQQGSASSWSGLGFYGINSEIVTGGEPIDFAVGNAATDISNVMVTNLDVANFDGTSEVTGQSPATIDGVTFVNLTIDGTACNSASAAEISTNSETENLSFTSDSNLISGLTPSSQSSNWATSPANESVSAINDGSTSTQAETTDTNNGQVVYNFVDNYILDQVTLYQDYGNYSVQYLQVEYWDNTTHAWVDAFPAQISGAAVGAPAGCIPVGLYGWNTFSFPPVVGTAVRITFYPYSGLKVGVNECQVFGRPD